MFFELAREILSRGQRFRFSARGMSMSPILRDGDVLTIAPISVSLPGMGDIVAFVHSDGARLVVHRVVAVRRDGCVTKGDNASERDGIVPYESILGVVVSVERAGTRVRAGLGPERAIVAVLSRLGYLRPCIDAGAAVFRALRRSS
jgi:signal peptidase I